MTFNDYLQEHGITAATAEQFGWTDTGGFKIAIPVNDPIGNLLFHKYRHLNDPNQKFSFDSGSTAQLYNAECLKQDSKMPFILVVEGEPDCVRLAQEGFLAVTGTNGASTFKEEWAELIKKSDRQVIILLDNDPAGKEGAFKIQEMIPEAWIANLPDGSKDVCDYLKQYSISDFVTLIKGVKTANTLNFDQLCQVVDKWLKLPDKNVLKVITAGLISHQFSTDPLWMFLVAPPSGTKTELITTIADLPGIYMLSDLTPQTFVSGMVSKTDPSLLNKLKNNILVMKDFTTVLTMRREDRQQILAQLREIYDGRYSKAFGTGKTIEWQGRLSLIAGVTSMIDTQQSLFQVMGERFVMYRIPQPNDKQTAQMALIHTGQEKIMRAELKSALKKFFSNIKIPTVSEVVLPHDILIALASLASFIVIARSGIIRDGYHKEIEYIPTPEAPSRLAKQLGTFIKAVCVMEGRREVNWQDYFLTLRIAFDIIPRNRSAHLVALAGKSSLSTTAAGIFTGYSKSGTEIVFEDLAALGLVNAQREGQGHASLWSLSAKTKDYFKDILPHPEGIEAIFPETDIYQPLIKEIMDSNKVEAVEITDKEDWTEKAQELSMV